MGKYAADTQVSSQNSRNEIERTLERYGAEGFLYASQSDRAMIGFSIRGRQVKIILPLPDKNHRAFRYTAVRGNLRTDEQMRAEWEKACRQRWRALALVVKAKLEAVECGISTIEREFLADVVVANGQTVAEWLAPQLEESYSSGRMPALLPGLESRCQ